MVIAGLAVLPAMPPVHRMLVHVPVVPHILALPAPPLPLLAIVEDASSDDNDVHIT